jgi:hypothetical protein
MVEVTQAVTRRVVNHHFALTEIIPDLNGVLPIEQIGSTYAQTRPSHEPMRTKAVGWKLRV